MYVICMYVMYVMYVMYIPFFELKINRLPIPNISIVIPDLAADSLNMKKLGWPVSGGCRK